MRYVVDTTDDPLNVRRAPSTDNPVVGQLEPGTRVTVESRRGDWRSIGPKQWVHGDYLRPVGRAERGGHAKIIGCGPGDGLIGRLWGFRTGSSELRAAHREFLDDKVIPHLVGQGGVRFTGLASRIGDHSLNRQLSQARARSAAHYLRAQLHMTPIGLRTKAMGERKAKDLGIPDSDNHEVWRAVVVHVAGRDPPPPTRITPVPEAGTYVKRRVKLKWIQQTETNMAWGPHGEDVFQATQAIRRIISPEPEEVTKEKVHTKHKINTITVEYEEIEAGIATTPIYTVTYGWGQPRPSVTLNVWPNEPRPQFARSWSKEIPRKSRSAKMWMNSPGKVLFRGGRRSE